MYKPAGFWRRLLAHLIDGLILVIPISAITFIFGLSLFLPDPGVPNYAQLIGLGIGVAYYVSFLSSGWQATPGKRIMGVYVVQAENGGRLSPKHALGRYVVYLGPMLVISLIIAVFPMAMVPPGMTQEDHQRFVSIEKKLFSGEEVTAEENEFLRSSSDIIAQHGSMSTEMGILQLLQTVYFLALALSVALTKQKTGFHDMICKTRAIRGRPDEPQEVTA